MYFFDQAEHLKRRIAPMCSYMDNLQADWSKDSPQSYKTHFIAYEPVFSESSCSNQRPAQSAPPHVPIKVPKLTTSANQCECSIAPFRKPFSPEPIFATAKPQLENTEVCEHGNCADLINDKTKTPKIIHPIEMTHETAQSNASQSGNNVAPPPSPMMQRFLNDREDNSWLHQTSSTGQQTRENRTREIVRRVDALNLTNERKDK
ncbi:hypothetical protein P280DRAFT_551298 [Massarina eburnea CBS 473.64]|uniref:Uncharacterized protein n=1 Tax=Massarina eburnea CBS 473.64 TaxID=1395130 RepID=A0A6A6RUA6_9PLEO|nr:hypothetical protein P280DRAFT_551298 [Massarina eburnea CBS 473.64]